MELPNESDFENYIEFFQMDGIFRATVNSILRTVLGVFVMILSSTVLGYAMTRPEYWHRKFWYRFLIATMYFSAGIIPGFLNIKRLGLMDNFLVYIIPSMVAPYNMILIKTYIESIPQSLEEAAIMDGAGYFWRFTRVIIPLSKAIIATVAIFTAVTQWNSYMDTFMYMYGNENQTLQSMLYMYINRADLLAKYMQQHNDAVVTEEMLNAVNPTAIRHTATTVTLLPILMVYPFFQKYFTKGIMIGAVKG